MEYYSKKEWNLTICDNMDSPWMYYARWNKSDRERQIPYDFTYMWNLKNTTNKTKLIDTENRMMVGRGWKGRGVGVMGEDQEVHTCSYK